MTSSATVFDDSCRDIRNGVRVEANEDALHLPCELG
jgi:hypothetical protein